MPCPMGWYSMLPDSAFVPEAVRIAPFLSTLKFRIVAMAVATGVLAAWGTANLVLGVMQDNLERVLLASERDERERTAELLASKLETIKQSLVVTARHAPPEIWRDRGTMETFLIGQSALWSVFDVVFAAQPDGVMLARIEQRRSTSELPNVADREYFQRALRSDQPVVSDPLRGRVTQAPLLIVAVSTAGPDGQPNGVVAGALRLQSTTLFAGLGFKGRTEGAADLVIDRRGKVLSHPRPERLLGAATDEPGLAGVLKDWFESGSPIELEGRALRSRGHLVSMAGIPLSDWLHVRVTPEATALQPVSAARAQAFKAAAGAGLLAALLSGVLAWGLTRPISRLRGRAQRMLDGETPDLSDWPAGTGELGAMALAFRQLLEQRQRRQAQLGDLLLQLEAVLDNAEVGIALTRDGVFETVSRRLCRILRCEREQIVGQSTRVIYDSDAAYEALSARAQPAFMTQGMFEGELQLMRRDGEVFWARMRGRAVVPGDRSRGTIWVVDDITQQHQQRERLTWAASHDALTGLANRAAFETLLEQAAAQAAEHPFCALFIDLDRFKLVNDSCGHAAGDAVLRGVATALAARLRMSDTLARLGGDEFAVLLPHCAAEQARAIAEKLRAAVEAFALEWEGRRLSVGASIGLVAAGGEHATAGEVLRAADAACYAAKRDGRNRVAALAPVT